ncbi:MAG TPA: response regulator, partial [Anaerolineae bacterium]
EVNMSRRLNVLLLEDNMADAKLLLYELQKAGFEPNWQRVETEADYLALLRQTATSAAPLDVILADFTLPQFNAMHALQVLQEMNLDIPFLVVSGSINEEVAVACIKQGVADYLLKDRLARLGSAVEQALEQKRLRDEQRQDQATLRANEERFRQVITSISDHIYVTELTAAGQHINQYLSPNVTPLTGYPLDAFLADWSFWSSTVIHPDDRPKAAAQLSRLTEGKNSETEYRLRQADGEIIYVRDNARVEQVGASQFIYGVVSDLTERKYLEEQLYQSQKMEAIGRLAGGIAHDFNNLLTIILSLCQLMLQRPFGDDDPLRGDLKQIEDAGQRAAALTQQLLAFSRKQVLQPKLLDLNNILSNIDKMLQRVIGEDIALTIKLAPGLGQVKADPGQMDQVIMNLAVNARDAMSQGGQLTINTANVELDETYTHQHVGVTPGAYVMLALSDTGHGMDGATRARIFDPFFTTKEPGKGTGLGLAVAHGIVNQSGGHIWVYSEPGQGTTFKIYLPRVDEPLTLTRRRAPIELVQATETILLVEDETNLRELAYRILSGQGYTVLTAGQGPAALDIAARYPDPIDLLITDIVLPGGLSGRAVAETLLAQRPTIKVLYMSGYTDDAMVQHGVLAADVAFIEKPFIPTTLLRKVREVLNKDPG